VIPARVDLDSELGRRVRTEYSISAVPTSLLLNDLGQEAKRRVGGMSADQFLAWLKDPKESVFASWQPYAFAQMTAKESHRPLVVLVIKDKSEFEILESAFGKASTQEFIQNAFVPTLLVESVEADKRIIDGFGGTVIPNQTLGALLVFEEGSREVARVPVTMRIVWSESEMMQTLLPYSGSRAARPSASLR
ncbi:MAG: thioredoxin family protein, partial [Proteobacteria bacterium]|nr:thioredoxin family protein [Pseudomonadota bacterium]